MFFGFHYTQVYTQVISVSGTNSFCRVEQLRSVEVTSLSQMPCVRLDREIPAICNNDEEQRVFLVCKRANVCV